MPGRNLTFRGGVRTVCWFVVAFAAVLVALLPVKGAVADGPTWAEVAFEFGKFVPLAGIALVALRREGVRIGSLGLSKRHFPPAVAAFGGVWVALNLLGVGVAAATGNPWGLGLLWETTPLVVEGVPAPHLLTVLYVLVVGAVEELAFRGYLQSKVVALLGDDTRPRIALGIAVAALVFGIGHVPGAVVAGAGVRGVLWVTVMSAASGVVFGVLYETTGNLYFVALLHGFGDTWSLVVDWASWSGTPLVAFLVGVAGIYLGAALAYRRWAVGTDLTPAVRRREGGRSAGGKLSAGTRDSTAE
jgi:membrane protease YdiL (CAAX protease family)